ncbi:hypothetical protein SAMN04487931_10339 [Desulfobacula phenolica]|uniref:Uncharacterized protein n=1 Tax=Desulfobacula phenolica TaxID=90732 RepID=A0A1H2EDT1_9BACT|nr:hypothetical protein SAMN04487931_10339 [Desulfobacula phenolica]
MTSGLTTPFPIVLATPTPNPKAAIKLKNAAQATAVRGDKTRVETMVAMELAASFIPFKKSNIKATKIMITEKNKISIMDSSCIFD